MAAIAKILVVPTAFLITMADAATVSAAASIILPIPGMALPNRCIAEFFSESTDGVTRHCTACSHKISPVTDLSPQFTTVSINSANFEK